MKAERPDDLGDAERETAAFVDRMTTFWHGQAGRIENAIASQKALPDLSSVLDFDAETAALAPIIRAHMQRLAEVGAWDVLALWDPSSAGWGPEMIQRWIAAAAETNAAAWTTSVDRRLIEAGNDPSTFLDSLRSLLDNDALIAAFAIAFASEALGFGGTDAARKSGLRVKTWRTTSGNPRVSHAAQDGETVDIDDIFSNGLRWPGDHFGDPAETANCSCRLDYGRGDT